ncbi:hypothetical protein L3X38_025759 [Prunus dulcis]|uniref:RNase H type-1 domain-containing protein n=1 Tax=Prunus dulcis TaxID=3755 RepID=A0AAD4W4U5_PRUDU|nr:hypothetical protein L3X38_025759 [Prunus dulcis]
MDLEKQIGRLGRRHVAEYRWSWRRADVSVRWFKFFHRALADVSVTRGLMSAHAGWTSGSSRLRAGPSWSCPPEGFYKLNVDGAINNTTGLHSICAVVRNDYGVFMGALAMQSPHEISILAIELQAIYRGVLFAAGAGFSLSS